MYHSIEEISVGTVMSDTMAVLIAAGLFLAICGLAFVMEYMQHIRCVSDKKWKLVYKPQKRKWWKL